MAETRGEHILRQLPKRPTLSIACAFVILCMACLGLDYQNQSELFLHQEYEEHEDWEEEFQESYFQPSMLLFGEAEQDGTAYLWAGEEKGRKLRGGGKGAGYCERTYGDANRCYSAGSIVWSVIAFLAVLFLVIGLATGWLPKMWKKHCKDPN